jgi:hypothetical protein
MTGSDVTSGSNQRSQRALAAWLASGLVGVAAVVMLPATQAAAVAAVALLAPGFWTWAASRNVRREDERPGNLWALEAQLNYCRRRDEPADVVVIDAVRSAGVDVTALMGALRVTDAAAVLDDGKRVRIAAALHRHNLDRQGLEQRLEGEVIAPLTIGWASFPEDGWTVDTLIDQAVARIEDGAMGPAAGESTEVTLTRIADGEARPRVTVATAMREHNQGAPA